MSVEGGLTDHASTSPLAAAEHLLDEGRTAEAIAALQAACTQAPDSARGYDSLADALMAVGDWQRAIDVRARAMACPDADGPYLAFKDALTLPVIPAEAREASAAVDRCERLLAALIGPATGPVAAFRAPSAFLLPYLLPDDPARLRDLTARIGQAWERLFPTLFASVDLPVSAQGAGMRSGLRIGLLSPFWRDHTVARLFGGLVAALAERGTEVVLIRQPAPVDAVTAQLDAQVAEVALLPPDPRDAMAMIRGLGLDALHYADVGMDPLTPVLARARLAPVQSVGWGHPVTTASPQMDLFVSCAAMEPPEGAAQNATQYTEALLAPDPLFMAPMMAPSPAPPELRAALSRQALGFPPDCAVYVCPQSPFKLDPGFDALLADLLAADPTARLILLAGEEPFWGRRLRARLGAALPADAMARILFLPPLNGEGFRALLEAADVVLDVPGWSGGRTTLEALAAGTPVVTLPGGTMRARHTAGFLKMFADLPALRGCVCADGRTYVEQAMALARNPGLRAQASDQARTAFARLMRPHGVDLFLKALSERTGKVM